MVSMNQAIVPAPAELITPRAGASVTHGLGSTELSTQAELQAQSQAAAMRALVEARFLMALKRPRDYQAARRRLLEECQRPGFAEAAIYSKPVAGGKVEGLSIRFAEAAARALTNIHTSIQVTWDDPDRRVIHVEATDLESNFTTSEECILDKTVERSRADNREVLGERRNTSGRPVYTVRATEDELLTKQAALTSKRRRNCLLALIPGDLAAEARALCEQTITRETSQNLPAKRAKMIQAFAGLERPVSTVELSAYLGHAPDQATVGEITELARAYAAIKEGETSWTEVMASRQAPAAPGLAAAPVAKTGAEGSDPSQGTASTVGPSAPTLADEESPPPSPEEQGSPLPPPSPASSRWESLIADMRGAGDVRTLKRLAVQMTGAPPDERVRLKAAYDSALAALQAGGR